MEPANPYRWDYLLVVYNKLQLERTVELELA